VTENNIMKREILVLLDLSLVMAGASKTDLFCASKEEAQGADSLTFDTDAASIDEDWSILANQVVGDEHF
jgi:hypothetical protein